MFPRPFPIVALAALVLATACGAPPDPAEPASGQEPAEVAYDAPPEVSEIRLEAGNLSLTGRAPAGASVRLAQPSGEAVFAQADAQGRWALTLPAAEAPRVFGVSSTAAGRTIQAQGYLLLAPGGRAAVLRAGAGAVRLDPLPTAAIGAFDFDREGGAVVSGRAPAGAELYLRVDGRQTAEARADRAGRFEISLPSPVSVGAHRLQVAGNGFSAEAVVEVTPAAPLEAGPFRSRMADGALRADWITPGGGVQSTVLP